MLERAPWFLCGSQGADPVPPACVRKTPWGLFCRRLEDSTSWQVVPSVAPHRTEELNPTPEALESVPLARLKWEYCYRLEFPLQEKKKDCLSFSASRAEIQMQIWLGLPARPQRRDEGLESWGSENWAEALILSPFIIFPDLISFSLSLFFFFQTCLNI